MLTVIFSTRDRQFLLPRVLDAYCRLTPPSSGWRLLIVDNGSSDGTRDVLQRYAHRLPLRILEQPVAGKSRALNTALPHLQGDLVVFTDDDAVPAPDWLVQLRAAADRHPGDTLFGGTILPSWPSEPPRWLREWAVDFGMLYVRLTGTDGPCDHRSVYGPNMAVRRDVFESGLRFAEDIGPDATLSDYPMGSEAELNRRLLQAGHTARFVAAAVVRHIVRPEQFAEEWILARVYRNGLGVMRCDPPRCAGGWPAWGGMSLGLAARLLGYGALGHLASALPRSALRLALMARARWFAGLSAAIRAGAGPVPRALGAGPHAPRQDAAPRRIRRLLES